MEIAYSLASSFSIDSVTVGFFDGCHLGHSKLLSVLTSYPGSSGIITFDTHPQKVLSLAPIKLINTTDERLNLLQMVPVDWLGVLTFDENFAHQSAKEFISLLYDSLKCKRLILGYDSCIGKEKQNDTHVLRSLGKSFDIEIIRVPPYHIGEVVVSSKVIRQFLIEGNLELAKRFLGRPYKLSGIITKGSGIGSTLGFPTINLRVEESLLPFGVYACEVLYEGTIRLGIMNLGTAPTFGRESLCLEAHIFSFSQNLYGEKVSIIPRKFLRKEQKFQSQEALTKAIEQDILHAQNFFNYEERG
ncbi:Riboflavin biosynthesis protein ribF,bifunctional riboflavin kinase/FMN adenylyltransferase,FAD synthase,riboflavin biosynthesis protein RibF,Riboflavin kinase [Chlamydia serpentis]|uniref:Riboflavin biosynthesis protein n=1 Tax=Chlamydia serpentis TaxID=1967782 RepID=A0A2R8FAP3_9CHLA|nr:bifunctional riboflavin kinase/FAD synthetase [Chlamydia serpentis]SPN73464.1 Riboflavin biosynthesis protein ribF,bifunctional riboflavin kinase/FMN adenylyltransferase,FAD synthase,riboflavin biosynthesis protein RibF,Riboflavin kinase [Chlamydia serpentis]